MHGNWMWRYRVVVLRSALQLALACLLSADAHAYVCSRVTNSDGQESGPALSWYTRDLHYTLQQNGTADVPGVDELVVLRACFAVWQNLTLGSAAAVRCPTSSGATDLTFTETETSTSTFIGYNYLHEDRNENLLLFRDDAFHAEINNADDIIALTTTSFSQLSGEIFDADIEFNSRHFTFVIANAHGDDTDLKNTAVHEIGHFLGLGHSLVSESTMVATAPPAETTKGDLDCDDVAAIVFKYPADEANGYCAGVIDDSCGYCAAPDELQRTPIVKETSSDNGKGGCAQSMPGLLWPLIMLIVYLNSTATVRKRIAMTVPRP